MTDDKKTKGEVRYRPAHGGIRHEQCGNCSMFSAHTTTGRGECSLVEGVIDPEYVCDRWEPKR